MNVCPFKVGEIVEYAPREALIKDCFANFTLQFAGVSPRLFVAGRLNQCFPSSRGKDLDVMSQTQLAIGKKYRIESIEKEQYIVVEGYRHPGGGIFWTEFKKA